MLPSTPAAAQTVRNDELLQVGTSNRNDELLEVGTSNEKKPPTTGHARASVVG